MFCLQHALIIPPNREQYFDESDELILEDELQRISLRGNIDVHQSVTGFLSVLMLCFRYFLRDHCIFVLPICVILFPPRYRSDSWVAGCRTRRRSGEVSRRRHLLPTTGRAAQRTEHWRRQVGYTTEKLFPAVVAVLDQLPRVNNTFVAPSTKMWEKWPHSKRTANVLGSQSNWYSLIH